MALDDKSDWVIDILNAWIDGVDTKVAWHCCLGAGYGNTFRGVEDALPRVLERWMDVHVDQYALDFALRDMVDVSALRVVPKDKEVQVGVVDIRTLYIESDDQLDLPATTRGAGLGNGFPSTSLSAGFTWSIVPTSRGGSQRSGLLAPPFPDTFPRPPRDRPRGSQEAGNEFKRGGKEGPATSAVRGAESPSTSIDLEEVREVVARGELVEDYPRRPSLPELSVEGRL